MTKEGVFDPIEQDSEQLMFGPRAILLCGLSAEEQMSIIGFSGVFACLPLTVAFEQDASSKVGDLVLRSDRTGIGQDSSLERLVLMSGLAEGEVHQFMAQYKDAGLPRSMWATLTPTSANWPLSDLLKELDAERRAMEQSTRS